MKRSLKNISLFVFTFLLAGLWLEDSFAWGPAAHLLYGMTVLEHLAQLPHKLATLLGTYSLEFLYGTISADIVLAKKLGRRMTHCHRWDVGLRLIDRAPSDRVKAFTIGYVSHLAADTISHNCFVPSKSIESYDSGFLRHLYWELMFDQKITDEKMRSLFYRLAREDFSDCDEFMESQVPTRIFDFSTNKQVFNHLLYIQSLKHWEKLLSGLAKKNPWSLSDAEMRKYIDKAMGAVMSFLTDMESSPYLEVDPNGKKRLKSAHQIRRHLKRRLNLDRAAPAAEVREIKDRFAKEPFEDLSFAIFR